MERKLPICVLVVPLQHIELSNFDLEGMQHLIKLNLKQQLLFFFATSSFDLSNFKLPALIAFLFLNPIF
jgi:hypothetical protein